MTAALPGRCRQSHDTERTGPTTARRQFAGATRALMVAADSHAGYSQGLPLAGLATATAVSGSQRCRNIRIDGHFSACGMPNPRYGLAYDFLRAVLRGDDVGLLRDVSRDGGLFRRVRSRCGFLAMKDSLDRPKPVAQTTGKGRKCRSQSAIIGLFRRLASDGF